MAKKTIQQKSSKVAQVWEKMANPLRGLTATGIEMMMQTARHGNDARLQYAFFEVERLTPIYNVCIAKRLAGVTNRQWDIVPIEQSDKAKAQAEAVKKLFTKADTRNEDGLTAAIRHLVLASFRGRSAVKPFFIDGELVLKPLQNWNFLEYGGKLYWNSTSEPIGWFTEDSVPAGVVSLPKDEVCYVLDDKPIDMPGILIYLRQLVGEEQWARFIEKQGIPQVILTAPDGTPDSAFAMWNSRAQALFEGGSGVVPYGSQVDFATEARSQDPFTSFIRHQMEQISILATGGTLMTLGGSTGLGSNLAEVQRESFNELVNFDCKRLSNAITNCIVKKCVQHLYGKGAAPAVRFEFIEDDNVTAKEYLELAKAAKDLGLTVDVQELKKLTKLSFISDAKDLWTPEGD